MSALNLWENFIESIAQVLSRALTDKETEKLIVSFQAFQKRLRELSVDNLKRLESIEKQRSPFCKHGGTCSSNCVGSFIRSFAITYALKYGLGFFPSLLTGTIFKKPQLFWKLGGRDTISFALFMSTFISGYKGVLCAMRHVRGVNDPWNAFVAGMMAGLSILLDKNKTRRLMIALYMSTRSLHFIGRFLWRHYLSKFMNSSKKDGKDAIHPVRTFIRKTTGTLVMMLSSSQILNAYVCNPDTLARSYLSFLITHGGVRALQPKRARQYLNVFQSTIRDACSGPNSAKFKGVPDTNTFQQLLPDGMDPQPLLPFKDFLTQTPHEFVMCSIQHPHTPSCAYGCVTAFNGEWWRALSMYAPLNLVMTVIFNYKKILQQPKEQFVRFVFSTCRSVLFLTLYVTSAWSLPCLFRNWAGRESKWMYYVNGLIAGAMVLVEAPGRRLELGLYCLPRAVESLWNEMVQYGYVRNIPYTV
ncbi:hypothetical protein EDD86DRAFT_188565 [Gorgonomyces haynaldii]|nr:hypothetical protein EDD86DRAFT_188565 [Gorgonomyces haynaldii]